MAITIRKMVAEDLVDVKEVDLLCWNDLLERSYGSKVGLTSRTDENILSYLHSDPEGALVASEENAGVVGTCFTHVWGKTGWVGPLSILPSYQSRGLGKELLKRSLDHLEDSGCVDIGLETMPENTTNLGMYLKIGLRPEGLITVLTRRLDRRDLEDEPTGQVSVELFSESRVKSHLTSQIKRVSNALRPGLDYVAEVETAGEFALGDTIIATAGGKLVGFSIVHTVPRRTETPIASVRVVAADPASKVEVLQPLLASSELLAADEGMEELHVAVPGACGRAMDSVLSRGYEVTRSFERLMWTGSSGVGEKTVNLCTWSG